MKLKEIKEKYNITTEMLVIFVLILVLLGLRLIIQKYPEFEFYHYLSNIYSDTLIFSSKLFLNFVEKDFIFDFTNNIIISDGKEIKVDRFFFSINQIALLFSLVLITKSPYKNKVIYVY